jgi:hypothetical protein
LRFGCEKMEMLTFSCLPVQTTNKHLATNISALWTND